MKTILLVLLLAVCGGASAGDDRQTWGVATVGSYHFDRSHGYCENNFGLGLEHGTSSVRFIAGTYMNSFCRSSNYLGVIVSPLEFQALGASVRLGAAIGGVTGYYAKRAAFGAVPIIGIERGGYGANIMFVPPIGGVSGVVGLQFKARFQ